MEYSGPQESGYRSKYLDYQIAIIIHVFDNLILYKMYFHYVIPYTPIFPESLSLTIFSSQVHVSFFKLCFIFLYVLI